jgi:hypothetical protein
MGQVAFCGEDEVHRSGTVRVDVAHRHIYERKVLDRSLYRRECGGAVSYLVVLGGAVLPAEVDHLQVQLLTLRVTETVPC